MNDLAAHSLAELRFGWGDAYDISYSEEDGWQARRRDGLGGPITARDPEGLYTAITADYTVKPVPRDLPLPSGDTG